MLDGRIWAPFVVRAEAKLINCPFSPLTLASLLRRANIGSSTAHPPPNHVVHFNQAQLIRAIARARPTSNGRSIDHQNHDFLMVQWLLNSKKEPLFFSAGEQEMIMNAYEEYKTIIMAKSNTAARERQEAVYGTIFMYVYVMISTTVVQGVKELSREVVW